jgi:hypothetical protein
MSCTICEDGRYTKCPVCREDSGESQQLQALRDELETLDKMIARGQQVDMYEYQDLLDEIKELEDE